MSSALPAPTLTFGGDLVLDPVSCWKWKLIGKQGQQVWAWVEMVNMNSEKAQGNVS